MTQPQEDDAQLSDTAPTEEQAQTESQPSTMPDENAGEGQHGRPLDDSDPGHS